jgi:hypothetical protein
VAINDFTTISGGRNNTVTSHDSTIGGGYSNILISGSTGSTINGGLCNTILSGATKSTIGGGTNNTSSGSYSAILGGSGNTVSHNYSFIVGNGIVTSCPNTTYMNCLSIMDLQDGSAGLLSGSVYYCSTDSNRLYFVP